MISNWQQLISKKDKFNLIILFIILLISTFIEMVGIGSIPIFAILVTEPKQLLNYIPDSININFLFEFEKKKLILFSASLLLLIFILKNLFLAFVNYFQVFTIKNLRINIHQILFRLYINSNYEFHLIRNPSELIRNVTSEVSRAANYIFNMLTLIKELLITVTIFILLLFVDFKISFLTFALLGIFSIVFYLSSKKGAKKRGVIAQVFWGAILKAVNQGLGSVKETKILNKEDYITGIFDKNINIVEKYNLHQSFMITLPRIFLEIIAVLTIVTVTVLFFFLGRNESEFIPLISLITVSSLRLIPSFNTITSSVPRLKYLAPSFKLVAREIRELSEKNKKKETHLDNFADLENATFNNKLEIKGLDYFYPNSSTKIINNVSFNISFGDVIGIVGPSGAGKSTLIDLITGLLNPSRGKILVDGKDVNLRKKSWQKKIGYIPQEVYLFDDTIKANIAFGINENKINKNNLFNSIKLSELSEFISTLPDKENTIVGDRGIRLSGGQKQRIGIARSLYFRPKILIFDEPTSFLDVENEKKIMNHIFSFGGNLTIIIISHRFSILKDCNKIINLDNGKIKKITDYKSLSKKSYFNEN